MYDTGKTYVNSLLGLSVANIPSVNSLHSIYMAGYVRGERGESERKRERRYEGR